MPGRLDECTIVATTWQIELPRAYWFVCNDHALYRDYVADTLAVPGMMEDSGPWEGYRFVVNAATFNQVAELKLLLVCRRYKRRQDRRDGRRRSEIRKQFGRKPRETELPPHLRKGWLARAGGKVFVSV